LLFYGFVHEDIRHYNAESGAHNNAINLVVDHPIKFNVVVVHGPVSQHLEQHLPRPCIF